MLLLAQIPGVASAVSDSPAWTVPARLASDDGYVTLAWTASGDVSDGFYKITETFGEDTSIHFVESTSLRIWRLQPGEYQFLLQACAKDDSGLPVCGPSSKLLTLEITTMVESTLLTEESADALGAAATNNATGGPGDLQPGHWYNPARTGHGWNFYWSNRLALAQDAPLFGNNYDLVGVWYTYEAKLYGSVPGCSSCPPAASAYRPAVLTFKAIQTGSGVFHGGLWASQIDGSEVLVGSADVVFGASNSSATVHWNANFKKESLSASDPLVLLLGSDPLDTSNISHFSGLWESVDDDSYFVATNIGNLAEVVTVVFRDAAGDSTWVQAVNNGSAVPASSSFCLAYLAEGYSPASDTPAGWSQNWHLSGCDSNQPAEASNRNGYRSFPDLISQDFQAEFTLPETDVISGSISIGAANEPVSLHKTASFHGVSYDSPTGSSCELTASNPTCSVQLTWYTGGNYPAATVYAHNVTSNAYSKVMTSGQAPAVDFPYQVAGAGLYEFELRMGDGEQTTLMAKSAGFTVTRELSNASPETPPQPATPPAMSAGSSSSVGATVGEFSVDASGSATYSMPILTAPASGGFKPNISLNYNSQGGNGSVGVGWSIGGLSSISLCPQTMEHDGISGSRGVRLDGEDRFCLDGQRLVLDPSTGDYGDDGAQYRTEIDSFARVTSYGSSGNGPAWFKVERKNGTVVEYGRSDDSRIEARGSASPATVFTWAQNRVEDRARNYITYSYAKNSTGPVAYELQAIDYAGNSRANTPPGARLLFTYSDRDTAGDLTYNYFAGVELEQRRLLQNIRSQGRVDANSPLEDLRFYQLTYDEDGVGRAILTELTECRSASRSTCYQPTRFEWLKSESTIDTAATVINGLLPENSLSGLLLADVSGDGRADLLYSQVKSKRHVLYVKEANAGAGFSEWPENYSLTKKHDGQTPRLFAIDINSDGLQDVVYSKYSKASDDYTWVALVSDGNGLSAETYLNPGHRFFLNGENLESRFRIMDFDGDGLSDILHAHTDVLGNAWQLTILLNQTAAGGSPGFSAPVEVDVDNADLFPKAIAGGWDLHTQPPFYNWAIDGPDKKDTPDARIFDFNGDGAVDLLLKVWRHYQKCVANCDQQPSGGGGKGGKGGKNNQPEYHVEFASFWVLMESNGQNAFTRHSVVAKGEDCTIEVICEAPKYDGLPRSENVWPIDINADGLADLAWGDANESWYFRLNTGRGFAPAQFIGQVAGETNKLVRFEDWNGDTYPDLLYPSATLNGGAKWMLYQNYFGRVFAAATTTQVPAGNVGGDSDVDQVENDSSLFADFNGDGKTDQLLIDSNRYGEILATAMRTGMNFSGSRAVAPANVITSIINGFGTHTDITYKPLTDTGVYSRMYDSAVVNWGRGAAVYDYIAPFYVVSEVTGNSPMFNNPSARNRAEYHYVGAKLQAGGRGLLGFAEIIIYDPQLQIRTNTRYRQDFPFTGLLIDTSRAVSSEGSKFSPVTVVSSRQPVAVPLVTPDTQPPATISGTLLSYSVKQWKQSSLMAGAWQIHSDKSLQRSYTLAGNIESRILTENSYDNRGNLTRSVVSTYDGTESQPFAKQTTQNRWSATATSGWNLGNLLGSTVTHARSGSSSVTRTSEFAYDPVTAFMVEETIEPGNSKLAITSTFTYDSFGNRKSTSKTGAGMSARTSRVAYDPLGRFVVRETNALGQVFRTVGPGQWDIFGNALEIRNIDGVISTSVVDLMGRPFASYNQTGAWKKTLNYFGKGDYCSAGTVWHSIETNGGGARSQQCFDVSGRNVRSVSRSITNRMIFVDRFYDSSGRPSRVSEPYFQGDQIHWNETAYDRAGRITGLVGAGGDDVSTRYDEAASGHCIGAGSRVTVTENALGQKTTELRNVLGETTDSYDDNCGHVSFSYDAMGYLGSVTGADGVITRMEYDGAGRKTKQIDPDKGVTQYAYNALGELTRQLDGKQQAIDFEYDSLGRVTHRRELRNVSSLNDTAFDTVNHEVSIFKTASPGKSQPASVTYHAGEGGVIVHQRTMGYDSLGRESSVINRIDDQLFYQQTTYDAYGRPFQKFDGSGDFRGLRYAYRYGHLSQLKEAREGASGVVYHEILDTDAKGNVTLASLGNGVTTVADYDPARGHLISLSAYDGAGVELQNVEYLFDVLGNLRSRHDFSGNGNLREDFTYDGLNRLSRVDLTAPAMGITSPAETLAVQYNAAGNITWKSDVGSYTYGSSAAAPHAVIRAGNETYSYDVSGNQVSGDGREIAYSVFDKVVSLSKGENETTFTYGIGNHRVKREDSELGELKKTTLYFGEVEYIREADGTTLFKRYLGGVAIANYYPASGIEQRSYLLKDHIGSIHSVLDDEGLITARMHFGPFGERQDADWQTGLDSFLYAPLNELTTRGFTGHEHVDSMGIIHMNGRIYDAKLGRFLQADPFVQSAGNSQSLNRYSYVMNNPLSYTDPTGFFSIARFIKKWGRTILAIAASVFLPGGQGLLALHFGVHSAFAQYVITGFIAGGITGGVKGAVKGAFIAAVTYGVTEAFNQMPNSKVQLNEADLAPSKEDLQHMLGSSDPAAGLYRIEVGPKGGFDRATKITADGIKSKNTIFHNGVSNNFQEAVRNGTTQVAQLDGAASGYILNFNPTSNLPADLLEAAGDISGTYFGFGHTELAENLAGVIDTASRNGVTGLRLIGHSQGAAITTSALRYAADNGLNMSAVGSVNLHGAPINDLFAKGPLARRAGISKASFFTRAQFGDVVHSIFGANFISNPLSLPFSAIRIPHLFSHDATLSHHTVPCFGGRMAFCSK